MADYLLPDVGEGLTEAEIVAWKVKVGDVIAVNDVVCDIETAKSIVELPSPYAGTVTALLAPEGETVAVGSPIISIAQEGEVPAEAPATPADDGPPAEIDTNVPPEGNVTLVGYGPREAGVHRRRRKPGAERAGEITAHADVQDSFNAGAGLQHDKAQELIGALLVDEPARDGAAVDEPARQSSRHRALAKPPVRKLAKDLGVDLSSVAPSGKDGVVTRADVEAAASSAMPIAAATRPPAHDQADREWREPVKGVRKMMAEAMVGSAFSAPHVTEWVTVDATATMELVARLKKRPELRDLKVSPLLVLARAVILAARRTPEVNSTFDAAAQEIVFKRYVNLGIAAATPRGLVVPNIKDAQDLSLPELAQALADLTATAREGRTQPAEMAGGTLTITNVGVFGIDSGTPIINPGESAILAFGAIRKQPWVVTRDGVDVIEPRQVTTLALSFDHRHIDGAAGSQFLADVAGILEDPGTALLF
ncbi:dihydrolipoamide acetyltransferase family protein [Nocardioides sp.]|uniref:dihydrolipoamide acetyltransferase family protein n=1 Tax=Nocardioides sp. TaxID=35761 RepID=UPI0035285939